MPETAFDVITGFIHDAKHESAYSGTRSGANKDRITAHGSRTSESGDKRTRGASTTIHCRTYRDSIAETFSEVSQETSFSHGGRPL